MAHFPPVKTTLTVSKMANLYVARIVSLHGVPKRIHSDHGSLFAFLFWESFWEAMGTRLSFNIAFHPHGQVERVNQIMEDILRACVLSFGSN